MKKIITCLLTCICFLHAGACDICGCGGGNSYIGILPDFYKHIFGVRYRHNSLLTHIGAGGTNTYLTTRESYTNVELWGGWNVASNLRVMLTVPYSFNQRNNAATQSQKNGISDISAAGFYQLLNKKNTVCSNKLLVQSLWVGAGIKLPTGHYNPEDKSNTTQNVNLFQLGTGSVDYSASLMYDVRLQDAGINVSATYKWNGTNKQDYHYGNKLTVSTQAYYKIKVGKVTLAPNAGVQYESGQKDVDQQFKVDLTGGSVLLGTVGTEINMGKIALGTNWQTPVSQHLAGGFVSAKNRLMVHMAFAL